MMKKVTTYFNTAQLLQYINRNSKLLQNLVQYGGDPSLNLLLALPTLCPHRRVQRCRRSSLTFTDAEFSAEGGCCCVRASVLKEFLVLRAFVLKALRAAYFPSLEANEGYGVSVLVSELCVCAGARCAPLPFHTVHLLLHIAADTYLSALRPHHFQAGTT
jgi:hypothetical protein